MRMPSGYHPTLCHEHAQVKPCSGCEELDNYYEASTVTASLEMKFSPKVISEALKSAKEHGLQEIDYSIGLSKQEIKDLNEMRKK